MPTKHRTVVAIIFAAAVAVAMSYSGHAQSGYLTPPKAVLDILDAPPTPLVSVDPTRQMIAVMERSSMPPIAEMAEPMLRLAGSRINPKTNGPHRAQGIRAITLKRISDGSETRVSVPADANLGSVSFSPDGKLLSFTHTRTPASNCGSRTPQPGRRRR
jgi:hypothetical protein